VKIFLSHIPTNAQNFSEFSNKVALASSCEAIGKIETFSDLLTFDYEKSKKSEKENSQREKERERGIGREGE
jgi:hypothetical protein